jgi:hypothetical protein
MASRLELMLSDIVRRIKHGRIEPYAHDRGEELKVDLQRLEVFEDPLVEFDMTYEDALLNIELRHALHDEFEEPVPPSGLWDKMKRTMETTIKGDPERDMTAMPDVRMPFIFNGNLPPTAFWTPYWSLMAFGMSRMARGGVAL